MKKNKKLFMLALDEELKNKLSKEAVEKGLTLSAYIRLILIERNK